MIISASRRTDIPAFYSEWFMNRIRKGTCLVPNPFNANSIAEVSLRPEEVEAIVFWSKNPSPMIEHLSELEDLGYRFYFQYTRNHYPASLEPGLPVIKKRIGTFIDLSRKVGSERVIWRYDPIIFSNQTDIQDHIKTFKHLCSELAGSTGKVTVSILDLYAKTKRNLEKFKTKGIEFDFAPQDHPQILELLSELAKTAGEFSMDISTCAEKGDYSSIGIKPGKCIDGDLIEKLWGIHRAWKKDPNQRELCGCASSKDIGVNDTCLHGCVYCYATNNLQIARKRFRDHSADSAALYGKNSMDKAGSAERQAKLFKG